jgi:hypothetical protein
MTPSQPLKVRFLATRPKLGMRMGARVHRARRKIAAFRECTDTPALTFHLPGSTFRWLLDTGIEFIHAVVLHLNERRGQLRQEVASALPVAGRAAPVA